MKLRGYLFASVCSAFLAASVAASGSASASTSADPALQKTEQAYHLLTSGDQKKAIVAYTEAIESRQLPTETLANALLNRAYCYQQQDNQAAAIDDYTAALKLDALNAQMRASALYNRGLSHQKIKSYPSAVEDYTSALFLKPDFALAYYARGNALRLSGQYLFSLGDYNSALRYKYSNVALVYYGQAQSYQKLKRSTDEITALKATLAANPQFQAAAQRLAVLEGKPQSTQAQETSSEVASPQQVAATQTAPGPLPLPKAVAPPPALLPGNSDPIETAAVDSPETSDNDSTSTIAESPAKPKGTIKKLHTERVVAEERVEEVVTADERAVTSLDGNSQSAEVSPWSVQVASANSEAAAWSTWKKMQAQHRVLTEQKAIVVKADLGNKGVVYRVRVTGFSDQSAAKSSCNKLRAGGVSCFISKNDS